MAAKFKVKKDSKGEFRWIFYSSNGEEIAGSTEGYVKKADCLRGIDIVKKDGPSASIEDNS